METEKYQSKSVTLVDDYKCNLDNELVDILEKEIRETEEIRNYAIKAMRDWTMQNPRIKKTRLDSMWLLKHLRFKKYSLPMAQEAIERHLVLRQGQYGHEHFHLETDILRPCVKAIFDVMPVCILNDRDRHGRPVLFFKLSNVKHDQSKCILKDILTAIASLTEAMSEIEEFHIRGVVYIVDVSGITASYLKIVPFENILKILKNSEKCATGRHKGFHVVNVPSAISFVVNLGLKHATEKMRDRVKFYSSFEQMDAIDKKSLPKEYGGTVPMKEMADNFWKMLLKNRDLQIKYNEMSVAEELYPKAVFEGSLEMLKIPLSSPDLFERVSRCSNDSIFGIQGSFRKLEID